MGIVRKHIEAKRRGLSGTLKAPGKTTEEEKTFFKTSGNTQGEDIGSSSESNIITRGSVINYRDKQKRQGLFGNIGTILGN